MSYLFLYQRWVVGYLVNVTWSRYINQSPVFIEGRKPEPTATMAFSFPLEEYHDFNFLESRISKFIFMMLFYYP